MPFALVGRRAGDGGLADLSLGLDVEDDAASSLPHKGRSWAFGLMYLDCLGGLY